MFDKDVSPDVTVYGPGDPELAVVCNVHGDEPTGARAVHRVLASGPEFERAVKFVVANPPASAAHRRGLDADLNRVFPGDPEADERERRLAAQLTEETADCDTVAIHTTHATPEPVAFVAEGDRRAVEIAAELPVGPVVNETPVTDSAFASTGGVVSVEAGRVEQPNAVAKAEMLIRTFLHAEGALPAAPPMHEPDAEYFEIYDRVEKPPGDESYELLARNFEPVAPGEAYAKSAEGLLTAEESFVPVLLSQSGYDDIFGYRGRAVGGTVDDALDAWVEGGA
ncbi:succinylglutamate desuccinylase [Halosimplex halobium]|uniref:succinylglutamate desuccinylase n=1 Tax=Halosimplex halobium TaxID=3396618 RepID=UPI003F551137